MSHIVYVAYTGALEPLGQSQVLPYLRGLAARGVRSTLISFEKAPDWRDSARRASQAAELRRAGIEWQPCLWRASLVGKLANAGEGTWRALAASRRTGARLIHARSHVAAAMAAVACRLGGRPLLFDLRGQLAEEYADAGHWRRGGLLHRLTRVMERALLREARGVVVLTRRLAVELEVPAATPVVTIPCCVDRAVFRPVPTDKPAFFADLAAKPVLVYAGSVGTWYLLDEMMSLFARAHRRCAEVRFLALSAGAVDAIDAAARRAGAPRAQVHVRFVPHHQVAAWLTWCRAGIAFISPAPSKRGSSPTKVAEYLACGVPVVCNSGIGDLDDFVEREGVGVVTQGLETTEMDRAVEFVLGAASTRLVRERCMAVAADRFDLERIGVSRYHELYERMGAV